MSRMTADELRRAWLGFFERHGHLTVGSSGLIPHHPSAPMFTNAGMIQFVPYFLGEEPAPSSTAASVQKCVRTADIEVVGTTTRHLTFFEMLGNFSFGDYFKERAIELAWEWSTEVIGLDGDRIWATVYLDDDEAEAIWRDTVGLPEQRIQRLGEADNFWEMQKGAPGPCGPNTELYYDRGPQWGEDGGPADGGEERYLEFWNLVFMQFDREADDSLTDLPSVNVDTGAGLERNLVLLQDVPTVFETDVLRPLLDQAEKVSGVAYGADDRSDVSLRILADHARTVTFLVGDGVFPSNEGRGYVLRRIIRRAVRHAYRLGVERLVTPELVDTTVELMGASYPELSANSGFVRDVVAREEERFRATLGQGLAILDSALGRAPTVAGGRELPGEVAFHLHDTHGFPLELTVEIAAERGVTVDLVGFEAAMAEQRTRAKQARRAGGAVLDDSYQGLVERHGPTEFTGREEYESKATVLAVLRGPEIGDTELGDTEAGEPVPGETLEVVLDRTPFYAESGGQVGDTGRLTWPDGSAEVLDTTYAVPGLHRHLVRVEAGELEVGTEVTATIDASRRDAIRRNHTATHLLHHALREVLGEHVKQQGSLVAPDRLRFDFSHYEALTAEEIERIEDMVNQEVLANSPVRHFETSRDYANQIGAVAFFGDRYGDVVRVLEAGPRSVELCGGTHVGALGEIGVFKIVSEGSIGSNIRRVEAVTGFGPIRRMRALERSIAAAADLLGTSPDDLVEAVSRRSREVRELREELREMRRAAATARGAELAAGAVDGVVVARVDGVDRDALRDLALAVRDRPGVRAVVIGGAPDGGGVAIVSAVRADSGLHASELISDAARTVKGGTGSNPELAVAGGKDPTALDAALAQVREAAGIASA